MKYENEFEFSKRLAKALASQFGSNCEVVIHDLTGDDPAHSIVAIENGHVTGRSVGDGPSHSVLESLCDPDSQPEDRISYLTRTADGTILKSTTLYLHDDQGKVIGLLGINYDISMLMAVDQSIRDFTEQEQSEPELAPITRNVADLLDDLIEQSVRLVGKPPAIMSKDEKIRAIRYLNDSGAFLITKSGPKVCKYFGISTYTLYSYLDEIKSSVKE
jgi:predicted transcriptional regulator YheO